MAKKVLEYIRTHRHVLMFAYFPFYLIWFFTLEHFITDNYWVSYLPVDDLIPFWPWMVPFYALWYPNILLPAVWLYFKDEGAFKRYGTFVITAFSLVMLFYMVFPNGQDLRPVLPPNKDFFTFWVSMIYAADTNTNVLPSLHVVGCIGTMAAFCDYSRGRPAWRRWLVPMAALQFLISISTVFLKQHSLLDIFAGAAALPLVWAIWRRGSRIGRAHTHAAPPA